MTAAPALLPSSTLSALRTIGIERQALETLARRMADPGLAASFARVVELVLGASGRVVLTGMGKSGLVGRKVAATLASTGTPALFLHPSEASHGDLGMIAAGDVVLAFSWSGETAELADVLDHCTRFGIALIGVTAMATSTLGRRCDVGLILPSVQEACPNDLAPTSSTTVQAALGDALAIAVLERRRFSPDDFRILHPRGRLGAKLVRVADLMSTGEQVPLVRPDATIGDATLEMSAKRFGITAVARADGTLAGAFSDGDLRRSLTVMAAMGDAVSDYMSPHPLTIRADALASEGLATMNGRKISQLFVCDEGRLIGIIHLHDLLRAGVA